MPIIYHLIQRADWEAASSAGEIRPPSLAAEGFIHCSGDVEQLQAVARRLYSGISGMQVLEVDTQLLESPLKYEPSRSGEIYPHIYGGLNADAVVGVREIESYG